MELMYAFGLRTTFKNQILNKFPDMYIPIRLLSATMIIRQPVPLLISKKNVFPCRKLHVIESLLLYSEYAIAFLKLQNTYF